MTPIICTESDAAPNSPIDSAVTEGDTMATMSATAKATCISSNEAEGHRRWRQAALVLTR